jgi:hypothetical protein
LAQRMKGLLDDLSQNDFAEEDIQSDRRVHG